MRKKITYIIPILILLLSCNQKQKQIDTLNERIAEFESQTELNNSLEISESKINRTIADTITNWQFYKDSELLFASNIVDSNRFTAEIKKSDKYKNLILNFFCDHYNKMAKREIKLVLNDKTFASFVNEGTTHSPFPIDKMVIDRIRMVKPNEEMKIVYSDPVFINGITVGILKLTNE